jgi:hypothetical protein
MPMKRDKGQTEKNGKGGGNQKATTGSGRSPGATEGTKKR